MLNYWHFLIWDLFHYGQKDGPDRQTDTQTDIVTYRLNRPRCRFSENQIMSLKIFSKRMS